MFCLVWRLSDFFCLDGLKYNKEINETTIISLNAFLILCSYNVLDGWHSNQWERSLQHSCSFPKSFSVVLVLNWQLHVWPLPGNFPISVISTPMISLLMLKLQQYDYGSILCCSEQKWCVILEITKKFSVGICWNVDIMVKFSNFETKLSTQ